MIPPTKRTPSLSVRQAIGILSIGLSFLWFLATLVSSINVFAELSHKYPSDHYHSKGYMVGSLLGIFVSILIGVGILVLGIWLLRDKKGIYIQFLKN